MILTVTLNPALDVTYGVPALVPGTSHRAAVRGSRAGGKGINVARVLHQLGHEVLATGVLAGDVGEAIARDLGASGVPHDFVRARTGASRTTVTVVDDSLDDATVLNEPGPVLADLDWNAFTARYATYRPQVVVLAGSLPPGLPADAYAQLYAMTEAECLVDATGPALVEAARAGADVLLPNAAETHEATGHDDPARAAAALVAYGAKAVVVSLGADGLLAVTPERSWRAYAPERLRGNPTGAGDALAAALAATTGLPWPARIVEAIAWSAAAVPMPLAGEVDLPTLERIRSEVVVHEQEG